MTVRVAIVTPNLSENSTGRAYVWWLLAKHLGWEPTVFSTRGREVWAPLRETAFSTDCVMITTKRPSKSRRSVHELISDNDLVIAVKPLPTSLGLVLSGTRQQRRPLIIDVDDPDLETRLHRGSPLRRVLWRIRHLAFWLRVRQPAQLRKRAAIAVSSPWLQNTWGGTVVPHARPVPDSINAHLREKPVVAFAGTARTHKGIDVLREAVAFAAPHGVTLTVTANPPKDPKSWESWVGEGTLEQGEALVREADIVALPSLPNTFAEGQLPAKLVDAMMQGRVAIVSDIDPMPWAVSQPDLCVRAGSARELANMLIKLCDPSLRSHYSRELRARAISEFSVSALAPRLEALLEEARRKGGGSTLAQHSTQRPSAARAALPTVEADGGDA